MCRPNKGIVFLHRFGLKSSIDFAYFGLNLGIVFKGMHESICRFNSKWIRKKEYYVRIQGGFKEISWLAVLF